MIKAAKLQPLTKADYERALSEQTGKPVTLTDEQYQRLSAGKFLSDDEMEVAQGAPPKPVYSGFEDEGGFQGKANARTGLFKQPDADPAMFNPAPRVETGKPARPEVYARAFGAERYEPGVQPALNDRYTPFRVAADMSKRARNWERWDVDNERWVSAFEDAGFNRDGTRPAPKTKKGRYSAIWMPGDEEKKG